MQSLEYNIYKKKTLISENVMLLETKVHYQKVWIIFQIDIPILLNVNKNYILENEMIHYITFFFYLCLVGSWSIILLMMFSQ